MGAFVTLFDYGELPLSGSSEQELDKVSDEAAKKIPEIVANIFTSWKVEKSTRVVKSTRIGAAHQAQ